jgi:Cu/Ag efflux protein CusF
MRGVVRRVHADRQTALIAHENIPGWMEAMTMEFPVRDKAEFAKLQEDAQIRAVVNVQDLDYWLTEIHVLPQ